MLKRKQKGVSPLLNQYFCGIIILLIVTNQFYMMLNFNMLEAKVLDPDDNAIADVSPSIPTAEMEGLRIEISNLVDRLKKQSPDQLVQQLPMKQLRFDERCVLKNTLLHEGVDIYAGSFDSLEDCYEKCTEYPDCEWVAYSLVYNCPNCCYLKKGDVELNTKLNWMAVPRDCIYPEVFAFVKDLSPKRGDSNDSASELLKLNVENEDVSIDELNMPEIYNDGDSSKIEQFKLLFGKHDRISNVIFSLAAGYSHWKFENFVGSARKAGFKGDIVLGVSSETMNPKIEGFLKKLHVVAYNVPDNVHFASWRYYAYFYWSMQYDASVMIWMLDFRDTLFQGHPFPDEYFKDTSVELYLMQEAKLLTLNECEHNRLWVENCCGGKSALRMIGNNWILNSGATLALPHGVQIYSLSMLNMFQQIKEKFPEGYSKNKLNGIDQGLHNWLFRTEQINVEFEIFHQGASPCNVVGYYTLFPDGVASVLNEDGLVVNSDGSVSPIIHQYDRFKELHNVKEMFRLKVDEVDMFLSSQKER